MLAAAAAVQGCGAAPKPASPSAAATVTALYQDHFAHEQNFDGTFQRRRALFAPALAELLDADARAAAANSGEIVGLDFDPLTDAQEEMTSFQVGTAARDGADTIVPVALRLDAQRSEVRVRLAQSDGQWRVTNLHYAHGDLVSLLHRLAADRRGSR